MSCRRFIRTMHVLGVAALWFCGATSSISPVPFNDNFDKGKAAGWMPMGGVWEVRDGALHQVLRERGRHSILLLKNLRQGTVSFRVKAAADTGELGLFLKFRRRGQGAAVVRLAADGTASLEGAPKRVPLGRFKRKIGHWHTVKVALLPKKLTLWIDGAMIGEASTGIASEKGYLGLYSEGPVAFDNFRVEGDVDDLAPADPIGKGTPRYRVVWANWRPEAPGPHVRVPVTGSIYLYVQNTGDGKGALESVTVMGQQVLGGARPDWVAFVRQRPIFITPGKMGQIEIRLRGFPEQLGLALFENPKGTVPCQVTAKPHKGDPVRTEVNLGGVLEPIQVNFLTFSQDLKKVYAYLQNNRTSFNPEPTATAGKERPAAFRIGRVWVDGADLTEATRFGSRLLAADGEVVPLEIALPRPLRKGDPVVLLVGTAEGLMTGHQLRAFPSEFHIQVSTHGSIPRQDWLEDIGNHLATAVPRRSEPEAVWRRFAFNPFPMIGVANFVGYLDTDEFADDDLIAIWLDEVDKPRGGGQPAELSAHWLADAENYYLLDDRRLPCIGYNFVAPSASSGSGYMVLGDAVMHAYGYFMCSPPDADVSRLPYREYRLGRRPFWPYFRDGEIALPVDPKTRQPLPLARAFQRCLTPREQRRITYGALMEGAKSIAHWGYWAFEAEGHTSVNRPIVRTGLGGLAGNWAWGYTFPDPVAQMLKDNWDEIGRLNAELRTVGREIAIADVCYRARVIRATPPRAPNGKPAAAATALVAGCDTLILLVLNQNIDLGKSFAATGPLSNPKSPVSYEPVATQVEVSVPDWLSDPAAIFRVSHRGIQEVTPDKKNAGRLAFSFPALEVSDMIVITSDKTLRGRCEARLANFRALLDAGMRQRPVRVEWKP